MKKNKESISRCFMCGILLSLVLISNADQGAHLKPLPLVHTSFDVAIFDSLLLKRTPHLYMVIFGGSKPQEAIIIEYRNEYEEYGDEDFNDPDWDGPKIKSTQWVLKYTAFKHCLRPKKPYDPYETYDVDLTNDIDRIEIDIDAEFGNLMTKAWLCILKETRYPTEIKRSSRLGVLPGYLFKCEEGDNNVRRYYGMTRSENMEIVTLGRKLISFIKAKEEDRESIESQCTELGLRILKRKGNNN